MAMLNNQRVCAGLVVDLPLWKIWISWDDDIPNIWEKIKFMFQTTNQCGKLGETSDYLGQCSYLSGVNDFVIHSSEKNKVIWGRFPTPNHHFFVACDVLRRCWKVWFSCHVNISKLPVGAYGHESSTDLYMHYIYIWNYIMGWVAMLHTQIDRYIYIYIYTYTPCIHHVWTMAHMGNMGLA